MARFACRGIVPSAGEKEIGGGEREGKGNRSRSIVRRRRGGCRPPDCSLRPERGLNDSDVAATPPPPRPSPSYAANRPRGARGFARARLNARRVPTTVLRKLTCINGTEVVCPRSLDLADSSSVAGLSPASTGIVTSCVSLRTPSFMVTFMSRMISIQGTDGRSSSRGNVRSLEKIRSRIRDDETRFLAAGEDTDRFTRDDENREIRKRKTAIIATRKLRMRD